MRHALIRNLLVTTTAAVLAAGVTGALQAQGQGRGRGRGQEQQQAVSGEEQQRRVKEEQKRSSAYEQRLDAQLKAVQQQNAALQQQKRAAAYRAQQEYLTHLQQQRQRVKAARDYRSDPYISAPHTYRYKVGTAFHETNQYGVDLLRQAVNDGYQQGYRAGVADREDHWRGSYQNSQMYRDADYGYTGNYVDESDYSYYFREGFRRGYEDGFNARLQYGTNSNGSYSILSNVLNGILGLVSIH